MAQDEYAGQGQNEIRVTRGRFDSLLLYEITDAELEMLEKGSPHSIHLNFGIALLTLGLSFLTSLLTIESQSQPTILLIVYVVLTVVGIIGGILLISLWHNTRKQITDVVKRIKERIAEPVGITDTSDNSFDGDNS